MNKPKRLIDADALLDKFYQERPTITDVDDYYYLVEDAPTIDAEPVKHGRWDYYSDSTFLRAHYRCSNCKHPTHEHYAWNDFKWCPYCGAKMDLEEEQP